MFHVKQSVQTQAIPYTVPTMHDDHHPQPTNATPTPATDTPATRSVSPWWRALSIALLLLLFIGGAGSVSMFEQFKAQVQHLQGQLQQQPHISHLAVLLDDQHQPALLVTHDPARATLQLQRLNNVQEGSAESLQLWAVNADGTPRSLGLLQPKQKTQQLAVAATTLTNVTQLTVSVERRNSPEPAQVPQQPYLFSGAWLKKAL